MPNPAQTARNHAVVAPLRVLPLLTLLAAGAAAQTTPTEPAEFSAGDQLRYYVHRTYSWQRMALLGGDTVLDHVLREPRQWGRGPDHYFYRYSFAFTRRVVRNSIELGVAVALKEDGRYRESNRQGVWNRLGYASIGAFTARDGRGNRRFAVSRLAATVGGVLIASQMRHYGCSKYGLLERVGNSYFGHLQNSLLTEFGPDAKRFGRHVRITLFRR